MNKTLELQVLITKEKSELALLTPLLPDRTLSSERTLAAFDADGPSVSGISTSKYQVRDRLHSIEINLAKMDMTDRPGQEKEEDDTSNTIIILWLCWNIF